MTYVITGATGNVGALVVEGLLESGARPRVFVRDAEKARARWADRVDVAVGDFDDEASLVAAFAEARAVFSVTSVTFVPNRRCSATRGFAVPCRPPLNSRGPWWRTDTPAPTWVQ